MALRSCTEDRIVVTILRRRAIVSTRVGGTGAGLALVRERGGMFRMCIEDAPSLPIYNLSY
jgi:hypothetical protein